jgi:hypothetical protein
MLTPMVQMIQRVMLVLALLLGTVVCGGAWAQTPTPTPTGEFLCSAGPQDGQACNSDGDCAPTGVCVIAPGICDGGSGDGAYCDCAAGTCTASTPACDTQFTGMCQGGPNATQCCDVATNCADGVPCVGTQKVCIGGDSKAASCLHDSQCPGSSCQSSGKFCSGGDFDSYACIDDVDCDNFDGSQGGSCLSAGQPTPTPSPTPTSAVSGCTGDCDGSGDVTVNEVIVMVNIALEVAPVSTCTRGDADASGDITVNEIVAAVNAALNGCAATATGEFLCSTGPRDGLACNSDDDCVPTGACVIAQGVCDGGTDDGLYCDCSAGTCVASTPVCDASFTGVCQGGPRDGGCCDVTAICAGGAGCVASQKVCAAGANKGFSCLRDDECPDSVCQSTGKFCNGGDFDGYSCVDANDCLNADGSTGGSCDSIDTSALAPLAVHNACMLTEQCPV